MVSLTGYIISCIVSIIMQFVVTVKYVHVPLKRGEGEREGEREREGGREKERLR